MKTDLQATVAPAESTAGVQSLPDLLTAADAIAYLRLDADGRDAGERLRNLVRRQGLPMIRRGRLQLFRRAAVDAWLDGGQRNGRRTKHPARLRAVS
jgi:hypothetical protein